MNRQEWYELYRDIRTPVMGENLFAPSDRAGIALQIAAMERKALKKEVFNVLQKTRH